MSLKHLVHDLKKSGRTDIDVYALAKQGTYLIMTFNRKHFEPLAKISNKTGIISLSTNLSLERIDKKVTALLLRNTQRNLYKTSNHIAD